MRQSKSKSSLLGLGILLILAIGWLTSWARSRSPLNQKQQPMATKKMVPDQVRLAIELLNCDANTKKLWLAVSAYETGFWSANVFNQTNNLFSLHLSPRDTFAVGSIPADGGFVAKYSNVEYAAKALNLYFKRLNWTKLNFSTLEELVNYMRNKSFFTIDPKVYLLGATNAYAKING